jgi:hypothetical protein
MPVLNALSAGGCGCFSGGSATREENTGQAEYYDGNQILVHCEKETDRSARPAVSFFPFVL